MASYNGHLDVVKFLIEQAGANTTISASNSQYDSSPFVASCQQGNLNIVRYFQEMEEKNNDSSNDGSKCLAMACLNGHLSIVKYILRKSPSLVEKSNYVGYSPMWLASYSGSYDIARHLVEKGAPIDDGANDNEDASLTNESALIPGCQCKNMI